MLAYQQHVVDERNELMGKLTSLLHFINGAPFIEVPGEEKLRMMRQASAMQDYCNCLNARIDYFVKQGDNNGSS